MRIYPRHPRYPEAMEMIRAGRRSREIAAVLQVNRSRVDGWRHEAGLTRPQVVFDREKGVEMLRAGARPKDVAMRLGCVIGTVHHWSVEEGICTRPSPTPKADAILAFLREPGGWEDVRQTWIVALRAQVRGFRQA